MDEILIAEDSHDDARLLERALWKRGVRNPIRRVWSGREAIDYLDGVAKHRADGQPLRTVAFLDLKLPQVNGFEVLAHIREQPVLAQMLVIVISQIEDLSSMRQAYSLGANSFIAKPAIQQDLDELIKCFPDRWVLSVNAQTRPGGDIAIQRRTKIDRPSDLRKKPQDV